MKIGLRTIKTAVAAPIALLLASGLHLESAASAAIITILTVTNTKRSTAKTALNRLFSLTLATLIAAVCFSLLGFHPIVFGFYLLVFIPLSIRFDLAEGIAVSSVLITHYLVAGEMPISLIINEYLLMILGVGCALVANLYMPNTEKKIQEDQMVVEVSMKKMLGQMSAYLNQPAKEEELRHECLTLRDFVREAQVRAQEFEENRFFSGNSYYFEYFAMRRLQLRVLADMLQILNRLDADPEDVQELRELFEFTSRTLAEENDGSEILTKIAETDQRYQQKQLPESRQAFEERAMLFQLFQLFQDFIEIKAGFNRKK
ncbi:aromatic acid exporter family protein [Enterococcus raffinosus]|uniref:Aromatic acid exporter family protein n=1 Tax=Enterococcus raffinosus TaxID=71452 RepID=A0AAW8T4X1_9ENTE|nr:aromatic acid exporter family protein [Enterococcus raffinosus]MDT2522100.1 aromatic acid exporter family protein [Enterococcus raffinosus]MDT2528444.1 aromatic acid exporter family protein [Enterococcus raffinosus]MDT2533089.1 aromatic acid exporter family protein [Enterococcus raffinosus]MDT2543529.1 aromatic acid exporter family protein [Enterococcus raffinosus]MDT2553643.1 aromatic acid exporter family protein [Enterococcus raffinosus]